MDRGSSLDLLSFHLPLGFSIPSHPGGSCLLILCVRRPPKKSSKFLVFKIIESYLLVDNRIFLEDRLWAAGVSRFHKSNIHLKLFTSREQVYGRGERGLLKDHKNQSKELCKSVPGSDKVIDIRNTMDGAVHYTDQKHFLFVRVYWKSISAIKFDNET